MNHAFAWQVEEVAAEDSPALLRLDPEDAQRQWRALAEGKWTLIDHFDHDGRRYLVAVPRTVDGLTAREEEVVALVAEGQCNKVVAYNLGIATSTVASHIKSAMAKLGLSSRVTLVARWNALPR